MALSRYPVFLTAGFRFFFLAAGFWAVIAMALWVFWLVGQYLDASALFQSAMPPTLWHAHEMVFGYAFAAIAGFFLTAVPNWTGDGQAPARFVVSVGALWLLGRLAMTFSAVLPPHFVAVLDLVFLPVLAVRLARSLLRNPKSQNMLFLLLLALAIVGNAMMHAEWTGLIPGFAGEGLRMALYSVLAMITLIGGRVVPAFTRNALLRAGETTRLPAHRVWADRAAIYPAILVAALQGFGLQGWPVGLAAAAAFGGNAVRLAGWRGHAVLRDPLLWVLHLGFLFLVLAYFALALNALIGQPDEMAALHMAGAGAIGVMTLAMMTRASLGHSGRGLVAPAPAVAAYGLIALSALVRVEATHLPGEVFVPAILLAGGLWVAGFLAYLAAFLPILARPPSRS